MASRISLALSVLSRFGVIDRMRSISATISARVGLAASVRMSRSVCSRDWRQLVGNNDVPPEGENPDAGP